MTELLLHSIAAFASTLLLKGAVLLGLALGGAYLVKRAAARHLILSCAMLGLIMLPIASRLLPSLSLDLIPAGTAEIDPNFGAMKVANSQQAATAKSSSSQTTAQQKSISTWSAQSFNSASFFAFVFLFGCGVMTLRMVFGWRAARKLLSDAQPLADDEWRTLLSTSSAQLDVRQQVTLHISEDIAVPMTLGIARAHILLPADNLTWTDSRRKLVLLHELAHIKRRDCLWSLIAQAACALHVLNPLAWLAERIMRQQREVAADDLVLTAGVRPSSYATELLDVARSLRAKAPRLAVAMAGHTQLEGRLRRILDPRADHRPLRRGLGVAIGALAMALLLPLSALRGWAAPAGTTVGTLARNKLSADVTAHMSKSLNKKVARVDLTIDPLAQTLVEQELDAVMQKFQAQKSSIVVLSPATGAILGIGSRGGGTRLLAVDDVYEPASTVKVFTVATALDAGTIMPQHIFSTASDESGVHDVTPSAQMTVGDILVRSSNIGTLKIYRTLGKEKLLRGLARFHFGEAPPVQLDAAAGSPLRLDATEEQAQAASFGHQMMASPLQIAAAFAAVANHGAYLAPTLVSRAVAADGAVLYQHTPKPEQLIKSGTAETLMQMLEGVVQRDDGTGTNARLAGYHVAGKTGSSDQAGFFVGAVPATRPEVVILVAVNGPQGMKMATGNAVAAPSFRRIAESLLAARRIPTSP